ncbi:MAG: FtsX-like permease family protein [Bacteroidetes bacterium]|nr:FtsX-like permease family protein [Bacteroidota bacterium]
MNLSLFIAKRYLISKKSHNLINVISLITVVGLTIGAAALIIVLSVFNGFEGVIKSMYNIIDADFEITARNGKTFQMIDFPVEKIKSTNGILNLAEIVEEDVLFKYRDNQYIAKIKGVSEPYAALSGMDTMLIDGTFVLNEGTSNFAVVGAGVAWYLGINIRSITDLINVYVPVRGDPSSFSISNAFHIEPIHPAGVFSVQQEFDEKYVIAPIRFVRKLMDYNDEVSSVDVFLKPGADYTQVQFELENLLGAGFQVKNRFQQNETLYKVLKSEKMAIFLILVFILILTSINMVGSLSILIVEKLKDIAVLKSFGATRKLIFKIFMSEGLLISLLSALSGLLLGFIILYIQQTFGIIKLGAGEQDFIIDAYPVAMNKLDFLYVFLTVLCIGLLATWYPVKNLSKKYHSIALK